MTNLSVSVGNALSGLSVLGRVSQNISSNVANALNEGYARREVELRQIILGGTGHGVRFAGVTRNVDPVLLAERRGADAALALASVRAGFYAAMESTVGLPDDAGSLSGRMSQFGADLIQAASRPDSDARLTSVLSSAKSVAGHLNAASDAVQQQRMRADQGIAEAVDLINSSLKQIVRLNTDIARLMQTGDASALMDERQRLIDGIAEQISIREVPRDRGGVAIFTTGGAILLDGSPAELGFTQAGMIVPEMSIGAGSLSGLTINGQPVSTDAERGPIAGGKLAALFDLRDVQAPAVQARLDAVARDLIERFEDPAVDPTLNPGDPGLFTDGGAPLDISLEEGLAARISVNALADPEQGGALWRLRSGLGAATPGAVSDATLLGAMSDSLSAARVPATGGFSLAESATGTAAELLSGISATYASHESTQSFVRARSETLRDAEAQNGVDTDAEMQRLLLVEQAFAANAKVLSTIDELLKTLIRM